MNTTHTTPEMRDAFEAAVRELFDPDEHTLNRTADGIYYNAVRSKTCDGWLPVEYAPVSMLFELWQAAQSQPAPPVPASVQEIMRLMNPYVRALMKTGPAAEAKAEIAAAFKPLEAAITALVDENHRLRFELDGVRAMRGPLSADEVQAIVDLLKPDHDGSDFEPECPACTAYQKLTSHTPGIEPERGEVKS